MVGLPASTYDKERKTAEDMIAWGVDAVRIYPTVVFPNTALNTMCNQGTYSPLSVEEAAKRVGALLNIFYENEIDVIRIGLCDTEVLQKTQGLLGAYHPALGELCQGEFYRNRIEKMLAERMIPPNSHITVEVAPEALSQAIGQKRTNLIYFQNRYSIPKFTIQPSSFLKAKEVKIHMKEN